MRAALNSVPGFRRRFVITPAPGLVRADVEDDYHRMGVVVRHRGGVATEIEPRMHRAPWNTCPGALATLRQTFSGAPLAAFHQLRDKAINCTHLYDLALLAAAHAEDAETLTYDILVSDPHEGDLRRAEIRRNGVAVVAWTHRALTLVHPAALAGRGLSELGSWIASLDPSTQEAARLLRWGTMLANGRTIPLAEQSDAARMPATCFTFQPAVAAQARRVGKSINFSGREDRLADVASLTGRKAGGNELDLARESTEKPENCR